ncbi:tyrosine-type recombinase/integrase [Sedimentitalea todarodis]|uniref:Tyrosine-type recombinase/integrase n=1 Tax=Sedimentitalea todarodis TaxID=1631240 RepID=A0ABU3VHS6_9RHOB|nr:tyrosine-type recombinase/integrase [Sedimentitalea todarodis]MDU9005732.1 tyrosine-type recombinase/integrase [Sedimentitalea todarodis]
MSKRKNPFPGVGNKPTVDRHGGKRWRLRKTIKGRKIDVYLAGTYGSAEFRAEYDAAVSPPAVTSASGAVPGTFDHVITHYLSGKGFKSLEASTRKPKRGRLDAIRALIGTARLADLEPYHVENLMDRKGGPEAANRLHKELGEMYRHAQKKLGYNGPHPIDQVERRKIKSTGFHTWTDEEVQQYREHHPSGTLARLALELILGTGAARQDACAMGRQNIKGPNIWYRRGKTGQDVTLPLNLLPELRHELRLVPSDQALFFVHSKGKQFTVESFGNWFREQCEAAELPKVCRAHGLRKHGATRLAERGATEFQVMAFLAHKDPREARRYVQAANRTKMVADGLALLNLNNLSNYSEGLDNTTPQAIEKERKK